MSEMQSTSRMEQRVQSLQQLVSRLMQSSDTSDKLAVLNHLPSVQEYLRGSSPSISLLSKLNRTEEYLFKIIIAMDQAPIVFNTHTPSKGLFERLKRLLDQLAGLDHAYEFMGGVIGYYLAVLKLILAQKGKGDSSLEESNYIHPEGLFLDEQREEVRQVVRWGIESSDKIGEIYPVGGAGDRLNMIDEKSGVPLPAALLPFQGRTLLEGLIRDLQGREHLYFKFTGQRICTPIAMMTSEEKNNHHHILQICESRGWFGRPKALFRFFEQPLVPVITEEGDFSLSDYMTLTLKPGGHGVIWQLAEEAGIFDWLKELGREDCLIRQINNPIAGIDLTMLALAGKGIKEKKAMGFISCERLLNSAEGTNVLIETKTKDGFQYRLTNIEYTDFAHKGVGEEPAKKGSPYSIYPTNTNILFVHLPSIRQAMKQCPIPGQIINMKTKVPYLSPQGDLSHVRGGRLESTMQNIADYIVDSFPGQLSKERSKSDLKAFIIYNPRLKTISTTKVSYKPGESLVATPEQAHFDLLANHLDLLRERCGFQVPSLGSIEDYLKQGPSFMFAYHPALGPLYVVIAQKIRKGSFAERAELQLEIAEVDILQLDLKGSLLISSSLGDVESRCRLHHVTIRNKGIDEKAPNVYWKNQIKRLEAVQIQLGEGAEFSAENVTLEGDMTFVVPPYHSLTLLPASNGQWTEKLVKIDKPSWTWRYAFGQDNSIHLSLD